MTEADLPTSVAEASAQLYGRSLPEFVAERDGLVKRVRAAGERELANEIKALRKPTVVADALNRALRADPAAVEAVLDAVEALRRTQEAMLAGDGVGDRTGGGVDFAGDQAAYRGAVDVVVAAAPGNEVEVRAAIEAAAIGGRHDELRAAAFAVPPQPTGGFGAFAPDPAGGAAPASSRHSSRSAGSAERRMADRARKAAERAVSEAEVRHASAIEAADEAEAAVATVDDELTDLAERLDALRAARDEAVEARARADAAVTTAAAELDEAQATLDGLSPEGEDGPGAEGERR